MISKLVAEMPGGFEAMNGYLRRNIAEALRTMQAADGRDMGWVNPALKHVQGGLLSCNA